MFKKQKYRTVSLTSPDETEPTIVSINRTRRLWTAFRVVMLLLLYFIPSISLTFYQRWVLQSLHFPLFIVLCHLVIKFILASVVRSFRRRVPPPTLSWKSYCEAVAATGIASGLDIGLSNWGLEFVTITLYTLTKSTTVIFILGCAVLLQLEKKSWTLCMIILMISSGLCMFTYKATQFDAFGFILLLCASLSSGVRWSCAQLVLQRSTLHLQNPIDTVFHVQPWMITFILPFAFVIEGPAFVESCKLFRFTRWDLMFRTVCEITVGACIAFIMEICEFLLITYTSSLTLALGGIFKDIILVILAVTINGDDISPLNAIGLVTCLGGIVLHVVHKIKSPSESHRHQYHQHSSSNNFEMDTPLIQDGGGNRAVDCTSDSSDDSTDVQELFNILNNRDDR